MTERRITKSTTDNLYLTPSYDESNPDVGLTAEEIQTTSKVLATILRQDNQSSIAPILIGEIKPVLELQLGHALNRQAIEQRLDEMEEAKRLNRRRFLNNVLQKVVPAGASLTVMGLVGYAVYLDSNSPEIQASRAAKRQAEKEEFEKNNTLGLTPSAPSENGWRVKYPASDRNTTYAVTGKNTSTIKGGETINVPNSSIFGSEGTSISLSDYTRLDGVLVPQLSILVKRGSEGSLAIIEKWILRDQPAEGLENKILALENVKKDDTRFILIERTKSALPAYQIEFFQKITR